MKIPLIIGGEEILDPAFDGRCVFYEDYPYQVANASLLDLSKAIGAARSAEYIPIETRETILKRAAENFSYQQEDLEHTVRLTGMPITLVQRLLAEIPQWLRQVAEITRTRFPSYGEDEILRQEISPGRFWKLLSPPEGFCYAVTPGNDPRSAALVAANLVLMGVAFILKASPKDAIAPLVVRALLAAGLDPNFCSLVYFESKSQQTPSKHFKLVDACSLLWTFGPNNQVEGLLRYEQGSPQAVIDLSGLESAQLDPDQLAQVISERGFKLDHERLDHFAGKRVLRHNSGNCAAIVKGSLDEELKNSLYKAIDFPLGCTATKSIFWLQAPKDSLLELQVFLGELKTGDPLDPQTQIGYVHPRNLDYLQAALERNRLRLQAFGGERLSAFQARPLLVASQEEVPDFFADEIPAYVLAVRSCSQARQAVEMVNHYTTREPRLAVSLYRFPEAERLMAVQELRTHTVLFDLPTSQVVPVFHEGNDYALRLSAEKLIGGKSL
jgi:acyl-CoA reductase-like NAD-dependent aldehyde dehydrogenase